ncbi:MAG: SPFH domain-containing protein [Microbacteriaceae bacterium]|nr:SPFH domain-containing protein [Microbacteriaceae bacterium]
MGLLKAIAGAISGTLSDQWKDFYTVPDDLAPTDAVFAAVPRGTNMGKGSNTGSSADVITNGTKILVPEGYGLLLMQDGSITGFAAEPGGYIWQSEAQDSSSIFAGDGIVSSLIKTSWERFKFGGRPQSQQRAYFVALKPLPNNRFGTLSEVYWDDSFLGTQVGAMVRGTYSVRIIDPILFVKNFVPAKYLQPGLPFNFTDIKNDASSQLFNEVISSLAPAFAHYVNDPLKENRMSKIQQDSLGFALSLSGAVEDGYGWRSSRGLEIVDCAIVALDYDDNSKELIKTVQRADALTGSRGNANLQASVAAGIQSAGEADGSSGIFGIGMAAGMTGLGSLQQPVSGAASSPNQPTENPKDPIATLTTFKQMLDDGLISQEDYNAAKKQVLGL